MNGRLRPASEDAAKDSCANDGNGDAGQPAAVSTATCPSGESLRALAVDWLPAAVIVTDLTTRIVYANPAFHRLWKLNPRQQVTGRPIAEVCGQRISFLDAVAQSGEPYSGELQIRDSEEGGNRRVQCHAIRVHAVKNQPVCLVLSLFPIVKSRSAAQQAMRRASDDPQLLSRSPHMGGWNIELVPGSSSLEGCAQWTDGVFALLGYRPGDIPTATVNYLHAVHAEDRQRVQEELEASVTNGMALRSVHKIRQANGTVRQVCLESSVSRDPVSGEPARLLCALQDVTDYAVLRQKLENKDSLLRGIIEGLDYSIYSVDRELRYTSFNSVHSHTRERLWGSAPVLGSDVLGGILSIGDRRRIRHGLQQALDGVRHVEEVKHETQTGSLCFYEMEYLPIPDTAGAVIGAAAFGRELRKG